MSKQPEALPPLPESAGLVGRYLTAMMQPDPFGPISMKREGDIANPDEFTWECDLNECDKCRAKYNNWKLRYTEQEQKYANARAAIAKAQQLPEVTPAQMAHAEAIAKREQT